MNRVVVVITGPIASGKSTVAGELARDLEHRGIRTAVVDLDLVHDMLTAGGSASDAAAWTLARHGAAALANTFLENGVAVVVADGSFNTQFDRAAFAQDLGPDAEPLYVTLRVSFEEALRRAQADPSRGVSRDPDFLTPYFKERAGAFAAIPPTDLVIDTEQTTASAAAGFVADAVRALTAGLR